MNRKRAIRYLRISTDRQSNFSIDGQDMQTRHWCDRNNVEVFDTFIDEGYSAKNFDRPDMVRLNAFITKHYRTVDYLVVNDFTRFSRDTGEALVAIKKLQKNFGIKLVSVNEGITFDADDPGSFFYAGLMLLKGEDEIIRNKGRINLGIYTAKKKEGRYLGSAPVGYYNARDDRNIPIIKVEEQKAKIVKFIYKAFLHEVPIVEIRRQANEMGLNHRGNSAIADILKNPVYTGMLQVAAFKDNPAELAEGIHEAIISRTDWLEVQERLKGRGKPVHLIREDLPFRNVLLCHCSKPLTGSTSRGRHGGLYNYYNCRTAGHNSVNADVLHAQIRSVFKYMSLSGNVVREIKHVSEQELERRLSDNTKAASRYKSELEDAEERLFKVERKWADDQMTFETYQRLYTEIIRDRMSLKARIEKLNQNQDEVWMVFENELPKLEDMEMLYESASAIEKQQLVRWGFDSSLYYKDGVCRTPYILPLFAHNELIMREKNLLYVDKKSGLSEKVRSGGAQELLVEPLIDFCSFINILRVA